MTESKEKERILREVLRLLGEKYPSGIYEYLFKYRPELYNELLQLENSIDRALLSGTGEQLKKVLREYWGLHTQATKEFEQIDQFNLPTARQEMAEERIRA